MVDHHQPPDPDPKPSAETASEVDQHQPPVPDPKPSAETASEIDIVLRWLAETLDTSEDDFAADENWEAIGWDEDLAAIAQRDYAVPPRVVEFFEGWLPRWAREAKRRQAEAATDEAATEQAVTDEATDDAATDETATDQPVTDGATDDATTDKSVIDDDALEVLTEGVWGDLAEELADAAGTWAEFDSPPTQSAEQHRYDLTKLLLLAPFVVTIMLLGVVAFAGVQADDAVTLAAALLGPLYIPLGIAIAWHYNKQSS